MSTPTTTSDYDLAKATEEGVAKTIEALSVIVARVARVADPVTVQKVFQHLEYLHRYAVTATEALIPKLPTLPSEWAKTHDGYVLSVVPPMLHSTSRYSIRCGRCEETTTECECQDGIWDEDLEEYDGGEPHACGDDCEVYADSDGNRFDEMFRNSVSKSRAVPFVVVGPGAFRIPVY